MAEDKGKKPEIDREKNYKGLRYFIIGGIIALWLLYLGTGYLSYTKTGGWSNALSCMPLFLILTIVGILVLVIGYFDMKRYRENRPAMSDMYLGGLTILIVSWFLYLLVMFFLPRDPDNGHLSDFDVLCTPFLIIVTILSLLFVVYEVKKPWKDMVDPHVGFSEKALFEPAMVSDSGKTRGIRIAIITVIGAAIVLSLMTMPYYDRYTDTTFGSVELFFYILFLIVPIMMVIVILLFIFYVKSKYDDWQWYVADLIENREEMAERLNIPDEEDETLVDFNLEERMKRKFG